MLKGKGLGVLTFYYLGYSRIRNLFFRVKHKPVARFVGFHDILSDEVGCLKNNLNFLKRNTNVVTLDDFFAGRLSSERINTVITFDDGYKSWVTDVIPILLELKLPATFFVSSGFIELSKEEESEFIRSKLFLKMGPRRTTGGLSKDDLKRIAGEGFIVGGHTISHCNLAEYRNSAQVKCEIGEDKKALERFIERKIDYFAYPGGDYQNPVLNLTNILKELGYKGAVTTESGFNRVNSNPYLLHREMLDTSVPRPVFRARVYGNYDAVRFLKLMIRMVV